MSPKEWSFFPLFSFVVYACERDYYRIKDANNELDLNLLCACCQEFNYKIRHPESTPLKTISRKERESNPTDSHFDNDNDHSDEEDSDDGVVKKVRLSLFSNHYSLSSFQKAKGGKLSMTVRQWLWSPSFCFIVHICKPDYDSFRESDDCSLSKHLCNNCVSINHMARFPGSGPLKPYIPRNRERVYDYDSE